tara:strand:+ start:6820 stop:7392 length:573 start_codon:yes stop_codon:yes gene_type:complete
MTLMMLTGPAEEPVTLGEARAHLRLDATDEDALLGVLVTAARTALEAVTRRAFVTQDWRLLLDDWPAHAISLPLAPVQAVTAVTVAGLDETVTLDEEFYEVDAGGEPPRIAAMRGQAWPLPATMMAGIAIEFTAGYGPAASVPAPLKQAVLLLAAHWFEHRDPLMANGTEGVDLPLTVAALIAPYRRLHL